MEKYEINLEGYVPLKYQEDEEVKQSSEYKINLETMRIINKNNRIMKPNLRTNGYLQVTIHKISFLLHRLIWVHCNGIIPDGYEIDHKDDNRSNNNISNLQLLTHQENLKKSVKNRDYSFLGNTHKNKRAVKVLDTNTGEVNICPSFYAASLYCGVNCGIVKMCCDREKNYKSGVSKHNNHKYTFEYTDEVPTIVNKRFGLLYNAHEAEKLHKQKLLATKRKNYAKNKDKISAMMKKYYLRNKIASVLEKCQKDLEDFKSMEKEREKQFQEILNDFGK